MQRIEAERGPHLSTPSDRGPVASGARYVNKLSVTHHKSPITFSVDTFRPRHSALHLDTSHAFHLFVTEQMRFGMYDAAQGLQYAQEFITAERVCIPARCGSRASGHTRHSYMKTVCMLADVCMRCLA